MSLFPSAVDRLFRRFCRDGDPAALGAVFDRTAPELLRVACYLVGNRADAEDLVQRTFLAAIESRAAFGQGSKALPWLLGILSNHAHRLRRERARPTPRQSELAVDPTQQAAQHELEHRLRALRSELGSPYAEVLQLHLEQGLNAKEIAERLSRPAGTVRTQLMRALELLRQRLPDGFVAGAVLALAASSANAAAPALAAMRRTVVQTAQPAAAAVPVASFVLFGSLLVSKKIVGVVVGVLLASVLGTWLAWPDAAAPAPGRVAAGVGVAMAPLPATAAPIATASPATVPAERIAASRAPAVAEAGFALVRVRALWSDRQPAAGVGVFASNGRTITRRDAVTDADGFADLPHLVPGDWLIGASLGTDDGISSGGAIRCALAGGEVRELELGINKLAARRGRVVDAHDQPVVGARIWMSVQNDWQHGHEVAETDAQGEFAVPIIGVHSIGARKAGFAPSPTVLVYPLDLESPVILRLRHGGGAVRGTVRDEQGRPIAWARLRLGADSTHALHDNTQPTSESSPGGTDTTTDHDGAFFVDAVPSGLIEVQVGAPGFAPWIGGVDVRAGGTAECPVVLTRGASVRGTARGPAGLPIAGAIVTWHSAHTFLSATTTTAPDGSYQLDSLAAGPQRLDARHGGVKGTHTLTLALGAEAHWDPVLGADHHLRGRVVDVEGKGLAGFEVAAWLDGDVRGEATTADDGTFTIDAVGDQPLRLEVCRDSASLLQTPDVAPGREDIVLQLDDHHLPNARIVGRLVDAHGRPVTATIVPWHKDSSRVRHFQSDGATGAFKIGRVRPGRYTLHVESALTGRVELGPHDLAPRQTLDLGVVVLQAAGAAEFTVTCLGRPASGTLEFRRQDGTWIGSSPVEAGQGKHTALPVGPVLVTATFQGSVQSTEVTIAPGTTAHATLDLQQPFRATVTLIDPRQQARESMALRARAEREDGSFAGMFAADDLPGAPQLFVDLPPGLYTLRITTADGRKADARVDLRAGPTTQSVALPD